MYELKTVVEGLILALNAGFIGPTEVETAFRKYLELSIVTYETNLKHYSQPLQPTEAVSAAA